MRKIGIYGTIAFIAGLLILLNITVAGLTISHSTTDKESIDNGKNDVTSCGNDYDHIRNVGKMIIRPNGDEELGAELSFKPTNEIEPLIFEFGEKIRIEVDYEAWEVSDDSILEDGLEDRYNFSIKWVDIPDPAPDNLPPEDDDNWTVVLHDTNNLWPWDPDDHYEGKLHFDFTPQRDWFKAGEHILSEEYSDSSFDLINIGLYSKYECRGWIGDDSWDYTDKHWNDADHWYIEYKNTPPKINDSYVTEDGENKYAYTLTLDVYDPDWRRNVTSGNPPAERGDELGVTIEWGDGSKTETGAGLLDFRWQIIEGKAEIKVSHEYPKQDGSYKIKAKVKDWYDDAYHDYSNEISETVKITKSTETARAASYPELFIQFIKCFPALQHLF